MKGHSGTGKSKLRIIILLGATVLTNPGWQMFSKLQSKKKNKSRESVVCAMDVLMAGMDGETCGPLCPVHGELRLSATLWPPWRHRRKE